MTWMDSDKVREGMRRAEREQEFWEEHYHRLLEQYPEQFVAVVDGKVIAHHQDLMDLVDLLEAQGHPPTTTWIRFLTDGKKYVVIL